MKTINLDLPYRVKPEERQQWPQARHVTENMLRALVHCRYQTGMNGTDTRIWGRLMNLMDEATANGGPGQIEVENSELLWIQDVVNWCFDHSKIPPLMASWVNTLCEHLNQAKTEGQPKLEVVKD